MNIIDTLALAFGSAWTSGLNLYATVAVLGLVQRMGWARLPGDLQVLDHWGIIGLALALYAIEFIADKVPYVDSIWDAVHTFVRVPAGALLALAATTGLDPKIQVAAFLLGGGLAFSTHASKAAVRAGTNLSPEPFTNWLLSLAEDALAIGAIIVALLHPLVIFAIIFISLLLFIWLVPKAVRRLRAMMTTLRRALGT
ncbi:MAG: DUF4126 domain-containing protein [Pyrinomonas sp.]|uniref:DUF4126 domain-containing protein n=1 Tax=Pyrinomonas sp. TaxID=2080306 RepID=UPI00331C8364